MRVFAVGSRPARSGSAMVVVAMMVFILSGMSLAALTLMNGTYREQRGAREKFEAQLVAEAGISVALLERSSGGDGVVGTAQQPVTYGSSRYWVTSTDMGGGMTSYLATGRIGTSTAQVELVFQQTTQNMWTWGAFGDDSLTMDSNAFVDSYDSTLGTYASQDVNGNGSNSYALQNGDVGSNGDVNLAGNSMVQGDAVAGPGASTTVIGNAVVSGSTAPSTSPQVFPPLTVPTFGSSGSLNVSGGSTYTIPSGNHEFDSFLADANATVHVTGPATIVVDSFELQSNAEMIVDATAGPVEIYVRNDFLLNSNTEIHSTSYTPADIVINLESDNVIDPLLEVDLDDVEFESNAKLYGLVYAPNATVEINSNFELFGSLVARSVHLDSNARVHFDEALLQAQANEQEITYERLLYRVRQ